MRPRRPKRGEGGLTVRPDILWFLLVGQVDGAKLRLQGPSFDGEDVFVAITG